VARRYQHDTPQTGKISQTAPTGGSALFPLTCVHVRAPASTSRRAGRRVRHAKKTPLHNSEIRKVTSGFIGTLLVYEK